MLTYNVNAHGSTLPDSVNSDAYTVFMPAAGAGKPFGKEVRRLLAETKLSLRTLAAQVGVDPGFLVRVLQGKQPPSRRLLSGVNAVFDLQPDYFLEARREKLFAFLSDSPSLVNRLYQQIPELRSGTGEGSHSPGDAEPWAPSEILSSGPDDPLVTESAAASLFRYRVDEEFRRAVDSRLPEIERVARRLDFTVS